MFFREERYASGSYSLNKTVSVKLSDALDNSLSCSVAETNLFLTDLTLNVEGLCCSGCQLKRLTGSNLKLFVPFSR